MNERKDFLKALNTAGTRIPIAVIRVILQTFQCQQIGELLELLLIRCKWSQVIEKSKTKNARREIRCADKHLLDNLFDR